MHHLSGMNYDKAKVSGTIKLKDFPGDIRYVATKASELYTFISDIEKEKIGYIYMRKNDQRHELAGKMTVLNVHGVIPDLWLNIANESRHEELEYTVVQDKKAIGSVAKPKGVQWRDVVMTSGDFDVTRFIYNPIPEGKLKRGKDLSWLEGKDYRILRTKKEIDDYVQLLKDLPKDTYIGLDTETTGLRMNKNKVDTIVGMSISHKIDFGVYIPFDQKYGDNCEYTASEVLEKLRPVIDKYEDTAKPMVLHNSKFDWKVFKQHDIDINIGYDTQLMMGLYINATGKMYTFDEYVKHYSKFGHDEDVLFDIYYQNEIEAGHRIGKTTIDKKDLPSLPRIKPLSLKDSIEHYFGYDVLELTDMFERKTPKDYEKVLELVENGASIDEKTLDKLKTDVRAASNNKNKRVTPFDFRYTPQWFYEIYGPADGDFPLMLLKELTREGGDWANFNGELDMVERIELMTVETLGEQEYHGVRIKIEGVEELGRKAQEKLDKIEESIYEEVGYEFNINSNPELTEVLYDKIGVPKKDIYRTKNGSLSVAKGVLDQIGEIKDENGEIKYPITEKLADYSKITKSLSSFYNSLPDLTDHKDYINTSFYSLGAETGRISSRDPNVQQMENPVRANFIPDDEDHYFVTSDFSQVERRLMGGLSGEPAINDRFFADKEADSHKQTYATMYDYPYEKVVGERRKIGKTLNFATGYGSSAYGLSDLLYGDQSEVHVAMAQDAIDTYNRSVPKYREFVAKVEQSAKEKLYAETYFGRRRHIKEFDDTYFKKGSQRGIESSGNRAAANMVVQGTAADIQKLAMIRLREHWRKFGYYEDEAVMKMNVHDEVTYQVAKTVHPYITAYIMKTAMEVDMSSEGFPPLYIGMNLGNSWRAGGRDDLEAPVILIEELAEKGKEMLKLPKEERPSYDGDIQQFWKEENIAFAARELTDELKDDYYDADLKEHVEYSGLSSTHKNVRVPMYAGYFGDLIGFEEYTGENGFEWFNNDNKLQDHVIIWAKILRDEERLVKLHKKIMKGLEPKEPLILAINTVIKKEKVSSDMAVLLGWFRDYGQGLKEVETDTSVKDYVFNEEGLKLEMEDGTFVEVSQDGEFMLRTGGEEVEEEELTPRGKVQRDVEYVGKSIVWNLGENDEELIEVLQSIMVDSSVLNHYGISVDDCNSLRIQLAGGSPYYFKGWILPEVKRILGKVMLAYYSELNYDFVEKELDKVAQKVFI